MKIGDKVEFVEEWIIFPEDIVNVGETGIVTNKKPFIRIKLDKIHEKLSYWNNEIHFYDDVLWKKYITIKD